MDNHLMLTIRAITKDTIEMMKNPPRPGKPAVDVLAELAQVGGGAGVDEAAKVPGAHLYIIATRAAIPAEMAVRPEQGNGDSHIETSSIEIRRLRA